MAHHRISNGVLLLALTLLGATAPATLAASPPAGAMAPAPLERVIEAGYLTLMPDGAFHPQAPITRAQLAVILGKVYRLDDRKAVQSTLAVPSDVPASHWAYHAIALALNNGIMTGYQADRFHPEQPVTRAEGFAILAQADGVYPYTDTMVARQLAGYRDAGDLPAWTRKAMATALWEGFVNVRNGYIRPQDRMTRADMAYALGRIIARADQPQP